MDRTLSGTDELHAVQLRKLTAGLEEVLRGNPFWRERLHTMQGWDDFERLPLTSKSDLVADQRDHPPFGTNLSFPMDRYVRLVWTQCVRHVPDDQSFTVDGEMPAITCPECRAAAG